MQKFPVWLLLSFFLYINSCGGRAASPIEKSFRVQGESLCDEVAQVIQITLNYHLKKTPDDFHTSYRKGLQNLLSTVMAIDPAIREDDQFINLVNQVLNLADTDLEDELETCEAVQAVDRYLTNLEEARQKGYWVASEDSGWFSFLRKRSPQQMYRAFVASFVGSLDYFSRYSNPDHAPERSYGIKTDIALAVSYDLRSTDYSAIQVLASTQSQSPEQMTGESLAPPVVRGDRIVSIRPSIEVAYEFEGRVREKVKKSEWISIGSIVDAGQQRHLDSLFESGLAEKIELMVERTETDPQGVVSIRKFSTELTGVPTEVGESTAPILFSERNGREIYIHLFGFESDSALHLSRALDRHIEAWKRDPANTTGVPARLILDLRDNRGGSLKEMVQIAGLFMPRTPILQSKSRSAKSGSGYQFEKVYAVSTGPYFEGEMVVLINHFSASASDLLSMALRDTGRATLIGETSFGKGIGQASIDLGITSKLGGEIAFTTDLYFGLSGETPQVDGVTPRYEVQDQRREAWKSRCAVDKNAKCSRLSMQEIFDNAESEDQIPNESILEIDSELPDTLKLDEESLPDSEEILSQVQNQKDHVLEFAQTLLRISFTD